MAEYKKSSPNKFIGRLLDNVLTGGQIYKGIASRKRDRLAAEAEFDKRLKAYEESTFQELDPDDYKQENVYEDIQVDTQAAEFASEQFRQQQANIMEVYRGTAGGSGVAALAQTLSNQAAKQAKDTSVNIAQQLAQNKKIKLNNKKFKFSKKQLNKIDILLKKNNIHISHDELIEYFKKSIRSREYAKFIFTKSVSIILENIKIFAKKNKININDIEQLNIQDILKFKKVTQYYFSYF